jgi:hypothetical protein
MQHDPIHKPNPDQLPTWRAAAVAYRARRQAGAFDHEAHCAAVAAVQAIRPGLGWKEASAEVHRAVCFVVTYHKAWFWQGLGRG